MAVTDTTDQSASARRGVGGVGAAARSIVGALLLGSVAWGHVQRGFHPTPWVLGLLVFPAVLLAWQWLRARRAPARLQATGPVAHVLNLAVFVVLYLIPATQDAALIFYGISMLLAALRGYAGCEVLAVSNWLLRRDDQVGCLLFAPVDHVGRR